MGSLAFDAVHRIRSDRNQNRFGSACERVVQKMARIN